jgi:hypothetical protein
MSKCPDCGRENVLEPAGYEALCGRRVTNNDAPAVLYQAPEQWRERMLMAERCRAAGARRTVGNRDDEASDGA